jgi:hypothetical protein
LRETGVHLQGMIVSELRPARKFYTLGSLPARPEHMDRARSALRLHGALKKQRLAQLARLTLNQTLCAVDALVTSGQVAYDEATKLFRLVD